MRESLMSSNQLELELLSSFCGVFETQRDNFLVFNLMRAGVTSYSRGSFLTPIYIFQHWKCQTQLIGGQSVPNKDIDKSSALTRI